MATITKKAPKKTTAKTAAKTATGTMSRTETIYKTITDRILLALSQSIVPWQKSWTMKTMPRNFETGREYTGVNIFLLYITSAITGYNSPFWMTFNQAKNLGGSVRKGEKATSVVFWKIGENEVKAGVAYDFERNGHFYKRSFTLREWKVFNLDQCDMPDEVVTKHTAEFLNPDAVENPVAESVFADMLNAPKIGVGRPSYSPKNDTVYMPDIKSFTSEDMYYHTLAHEFVHSTGHTTRLNRPEVMETKGRMGPDQGSYGREELTAEIGACFVSGRLGIDVEGIVATSADYIREWSKAIKNDPAMIMSAATRATKATKYIFNEIVFEVAETTAE